MFFFSVFIIFFIQMYLTKKNIIQVFTLDFERSEAVQKKKKKYYYNNNFMTSHVQHVLHNYILLSLCRRLMIINEKRGEKK